jgi:hypothetical protein
MLASLLRLEGRFIVREMACPMTPAAFKCAQPGLNASENPALPYLPGHGCDLDHSQLMMPNHIVLPFQVHTQIRQEEKIMSTDKKETAKQNPKTPAPESKNKIGKSGETQLSEKELSRTTGGSATGGAGAGKIKF